MAKQNILVGASANDKTGDTLRNAFIKANANFTELYTLTGGTAADLRELVQDYAAPLFNHASHTNITATYDDANNKILLTGVASGSASSLINGAYTASLGSTGKLTAPGNLQVDGGKIIVHPYGASYIESVGYGISDPTSSLNIFAGPYQKIKLRAGFGTEAFWTFGTDGKLTFPDATYQTTAWKGIPGPYADDAAAAAASVAVGYPYHKTGTSGQVFVRLT